MFGSCHFFLAILIVVSYKERVALVEESCKIIMSRTAGTVARVNGRADYRGRRPRMERGHYTFGKGRVKRGVGRVCPDEGRSAAV